MEHQFPPPQQVLTTLYEVVSCQHCGQKARRYKFEPKVLVYYDETGKCSKYSTAPCPGPTVKELQPLGKIADDPNNWKSDEEKSMKASGRHKFKLHIETHPKGKILICECGLKMLEYENGLKAYLNDDNKIRAKMPHACTIARSKDKNDVKRKIKPRQTQIKEQSSKPIFIPNPIPSKVVQYKEKPEVEEDIQDVVTRTPVKPITLATKSTFTTATTPFKSMTNDEARLFEAYVIINVMYEEMVKNNLRTQGRYMAGTLLYSAGYVEKIKHLESK